MQGGAGPGLRASTKYEGKSARVQRGLGQWVWSDRVDHTPSDVTCHQSSFGYISPCAIVNAGVEYAKPRIWSRLSSIHSCRASSDASNGA
jgi:hypothetical protein